MLVSSRDSCNSKSPICEPDGKRRRWAHSGQSQGSSSGGSRSGGSSQPGGSEELKSREYRDNQGEVHHHTKTYEEQHGKDKGKNAA